MDTLVNDVSYSVGFTQLLSKQPYRISDAEWDGFESRHESYRRFFAIAIRICRDALASAGPSELRDWIFDGSDRPLGLAYHRSLRDSDWSAPQFFRTDEAQPGRVFEIQCPGSLWGELELLHVLHARGLLHVPATQSPSPAALVVRQLEQCLGTAPVVHHMLDHASIPGTMRYFVDRTRWHGVKYWGFDRGLRPGDCNFIRSHSLQGLLADPFAAERLRRVGVDLRYDLPLHALFAQKATLVLPFWSVTRSHFPDDVRAALIFTAPLLESGIEMPDGGHLSLEQFARRSRNERRFFLKYAGTDLALNWGSKGVERLSNCSSSTCLSLLRRCVRDRGGTGKWVLQPECSQSDPIEWSTREGGAVRATLRLKLSAFYGPFGSVGALAMHRTHTKVHSHDDTVLSAVARPA